MSRGVAGDSVFIDMPKQEEEVLCWTALVLLMNITLKQVKRGLD